MAVKASLRSAAASDPGRRRKNNEDRYFVDADRGIFAVIDGVGGHAAGERAAQVAVDVIRERLERPTGSPEERLREAIALANNEIYRLAKSRTEWNGMACVLTIALIEDDIVTVGHVGDTRLYLLRAGEIQKITHDHSPVGEREDRGELTEEEAMRHSRRNEIYRDVGSGERKPDEIGFIELTSFAMPPDAALLLCSDGLTDLVSSAEILAGADRYANDLDAAVKALIDVANHAGGKDNVTVVMVAGPEYPRDTQVTAALAARPLPRPDLHRWLFLAAGLLLGAALGAAGWYGWQRFGATGPRMLTVGAEKISDVIRRSHAGDTVIIPQGRYKERIELRECVTIRSQQPGMVVTLISPDGGPVVVARKINSGTLEGVSIQGDIAAPVADAIEIIDSSPVISNVKISGAGQGIRISGGSAPLITSSQITNNLGAGIVVSPGAKPRIESNLIAANGNGRPGEAQPGVDVDDRAHPLLKDNAIVDNSAEPVWIHGSSYQPADFEENFFGGLPASEAIRLIGSH